MAARTRLVRPKSIVDDAWLQLGNLDGVEINNPLIGRHKDDIEQPGLLEVRLMRNPDYLSFAAKVLLDIDLLPGQALILEELWNRPFPMYIGSRGYGKTFLLAVLAMLKCALIPNMKVVGVGAAFRQAKFIFEYMESIWNNAPVLKSVCDGNSGPKVNADRCSILINDSVARFVPLGDGQKIRGMRARLILADEFASINPAIYETVIGGFASVSARPVEGVKERARQKAIKGQYKDYSPNKASYLSNQSIISGTADYDFMHFADYWKKYWVFIHSKNDPNKVIQLPGGDTRTLKDCFPNGEIDPSFDYKDYSIIRIPYELVPEGFMDEKVVARSKASSDPSIILKEYHACFPKDSAGFFKRTVIEGCVANDKNLNNEHWPSWCNSPFDPILKGHPGRQYVIGIDPAAAQDNLSIVVLELWPQHVRVAYAWSTNLADFKNRKKGKMTNEEDYYSFCARRIRNLTKVFPTDDIAIDAQGGGLALMEALHDSQKFNASNGEVAFWPTNRILRPDKELDTDDEAGRHNLHMCQFADANFTSEANHGTLKDMLDKTLLFPRFDSVSLELAHYGDAELAKSLGQTRIYDTLEDAVMEIEELKNEMCSIVMSRTGTGVNSRDRWDTPETTTKDGKKTRMHKDRYSALIMANYIARHIQRAPAPIEYNVIGGFSHQIVARSNQNTGKLYNGPEWFTNPINQSKGVIRVVKKRSV